MKMRSTSCFIQAMLRICIVVYYIVSVEGYNCSEVECPENLPYCSSVGCLFECPRDSFIDGRTCRVDCGEKYIHRNKCVDICPETASFVEIQVSVKSHELLKFKFCREHCPLDTYIFNKKCEKSCPESSKFVENNTCEPSCSKEKLRRNITVNSRLTAIKCVESCDFGQFVQGGFCVNSCSRDQVIYNGVCITECPQNATIKDTDDIGNTFCKANCIDSIRGYIQNGSCVVNCDNGLVVTNNNCKKICPKDEPLKYVHTFGTTFCVNDCSQFRAQLQENGYCVTKCNDSNKMFQNKCVKKCPVNAPIIVFDAYHMKYCEPKTYCETNGNLVYNNTCVKYCPDNANFVYNNECVDKCPPDSPLHCQEDNYKCRLFDNYFTLARNTICISECPISYKMYNNMCLSECPRDTYIFNSTCVESCIGPMPYVYRKSCVSECPALGTWKLYNDICVTDCPDKTLIQSGECVKNCSGSTPYIYGKECVSKCPVSGTWKIYKSECFKKCPVDTYALKTNCVDNCTGTFPYINGSNCVSECPSGTQKDGQHCSKIVMPIITACKPDELLDNVSCIKKANCEKVIIFNGTCSNSCPVGYIFTRVKETPCMLRTDLIDTLLLLLGIGVIIILFALAFLSMKRFDVCKICCCIKRRKLSTNIRIVEDTEDTEPLVENHSENADEILDV